MAERTISGVMTFTDAEGRTIATGEGTVRLTEETPQADAPGPFLATQTRTAEGANVDLKMFLGGEPLAWGAWQMAPEQRALLHDDRFRYFRRRSWMGYRIGVDYGETVTHSCRRLMASLGVAGVALGGL